MATSGTYNFNPAIGHLVTAAYARIQIHRAEILQEHLTNAIVECNLMQALWANLGPTLWTVTQNQIVLVQGTISYSIPADVVMMLDVWVSDSNGDGTYTDRIMTPYSRTEYASIPDKSQQGSPTSFWFDRLINGNVYLWPVPDGTDAYVNYFCFTQTQDAQLTNATTPQVPYLWLDAYVAGLAHRLARIYKPDLEAAREADAQKAYQAASMQGTENVNLYIAPQIQSYWRV